MVNKSKEDAASRIPAADKREEEPVSATNTQRRFSWPEDYQEIMAAFVRGWKTVIQCESIDVNMAALCAGLREVVGASCEAEAALAAKDEEIARLDKLINTPSIHEFMEAVRLEAGHQRQRWAADHDSGKTDADWFWLIGYLAGKALRPQQPQEKRLHHIITTAAVCLNWHRHATGEATEMRPGIQEPTSEAESARLRGQK